MKFVFNLTLSPGIGDTSVKMTLMQKLLLKLPRWLPAVLLMAAIFAFSSIPSNDMPRFGVFDFSIKKGGHMLGYALLALAFLHWLWPFQTVGQPVPGRLLLLAWLLALVYAVSDEFHQSFVPGRGPSVFDVLIDSVGAALALAIYAAWQRKKAGV